MAGLMRALCRGCIELLIFVGRIAGLGGFRAVGISMLRRNVVLGCAEGSRRFSGFKVNKGGLMFSARLLNY